MAITSFAMSHPGRPSAYFQRGPHIKKDARPRSGALLQRDVILPPRRCVLDGLKVQRARRIVVGAGLIRETLADRREAVLGPRDGALMKMDQVASNLRLDFAVALDRVERLDGSK